MKKWRIPAKTFLLGEYVAMTGGPAIVLTTSPCFEITLSLTSNTIDSRPIHPQSPAGLLWAKTSHVEQLNWHDPYRERGGLGASSAQFLGAYLADTYLNHQTMTQQTMLEQYFSYAWSGRGLRPSGYDVLAQLSSGCVFIHQNEKQCVSYPWPFDDIGFILIHTMQKLATHEHLRQVALPQALSSLEVVVHAAKQAFNDANSEQLINAVNTYHQTLQHMGLMASHTCAMLEELRVHFDCLAMKGCGAMGADVLLLLVSRQYLSANVVRLSQLGYTVLATSNELYQD
jgi:mevalonate kinase